MGDRAAVEAKAKNDVLDGTASQRVVSEDLLEAAAVEIERLRSELTEAAYDLDDARPRD
jgi:hypothetical protein